MGARIDSIRSRLPGRRRGDGDAESRVDPALLARRDRLVERFTAHQLDLGGVLYEMAIRDHVVMPVLLERAAVLQGIEADLKLVEEEVAAAERAEVAAVGAKESGPPAGGSVPERSCIACGAVVAADSAFCSKCGGRL